MRVAGTAAAALLLLFVSRWDWVIDRGWDAVYFFRSEMRRQFPSFRANVSGEPCSLHELLHGSWTVAAAADAYVPRCYAEGRANLDPRQDCKPFAEATDFLSRVWRPAAGPSACPLPPASGSFPCPALRDATVVFLGDSMARNFGQAAECRLADTDLGARVFILSSRIGPEREYLWNLLSVESIQNVHRLVEASIGESIDHVDVVVVNTGLWWTPGNFPELADILLPPPPSPSPAVAPATGAASQRLLHERALSEGFSEGYDDAAPDRRLARAGAAPSPGPKADPWRTKWDRDFPGGLPAAQEWIREAIRQRVVALDALAASGTHVIWRVPDISHFGPNTRFNWSSCATEPEPRWMERQQWDVVRDIYAAVMEFSRGTRVHVMDVQRMADARPDAHPGAVMRVSGLGVENHDCAHWCMPGLPDAWTGVLLAHLCGQPPSPSPLPSETVPN